MLRNLMLLFAILAALAWRSSPTPYNISLRSRNHLLYAWQEVHVSVNDQVAHAKLLDEHHAQLNMIGVAAANIVQRKVLVSLTSVSFRINEIGKSLYSILNGVVLPSQIYLFISEDPYLIDKGIKIIPEFLLTLSQQKMLKIIYTDNTGPYRKLLPILARYYHDPDTVIVTIDDDMSYGQFNSTLLYHLLESFQANNGSSVVAMRAHRIGLCSINSDDSPVRFTQYKAWQTPPHKGQTEMLLLPTGMGGVLYRPNFFHKVVFSESFRNVTSMADDLAFRLSCMANRIPVTLACGNCRVNVDDVLRKYSHASLLSLHGSKRTSNIHATHLSRDNTALKGGSDFQLQQQSRLLWNEEGLYKLNTRKGKNDDQWIAAIEYLERHGIVSNFTSGFVRGHYFERDKKCYLTDTAGSKPLHPCSIYHCDADLLQKYPSGVVKVLVK